MGLAFAAPDLIFCSAEDIFFGVYDLVLGMKGGAVKKCILNQCFNQQKALEVSNLLKIFYEESIKGYAWPLKWYLFQFYLLPVHFEGQKNLNIRELNDNSPSMKIS